MTRRRSVGFGFLLAVVLHGAVAAAQRHLPPAYFDEPSTVRVVGAPRPGEEIPALIVLPPTGGTAADMADLFQPFISTPYVVILPHGAPTRAEYDRDFDAFVGWVEARIFTDLANARARYPIDPRRIVLAGFSLGGDLAWALLARHPDRFRGAFVASSRCGAAMSAQALATLRAHDASVVFAIGRHDVAYRLAGLHGAARAVAAAGITSRLFEFEGEHQPAPGVPIVVDAFRLLFEH